MKSHSSLVRSSGVIAFATLCSRILGLVRDQAIAAIFTRSLSVPFLTAFIIPNTLRRLFAEGALSSAFIPVFGETLHTNGRERAAQLGASMLKLLFLFLLLVSILGCLFSPQIIRLISEEDQITPEEGLMAIRLMRIMFPYILLIGLSAVVMGMLHTFGRFFPSAISPVLLNVAMISAMILAVLMLTPTQGVVLLSCGVLLGGALQLLVQFLPLRREISLKLLSAPLVDPAVKKVILLMVPLIFGQAIHQINVLVSAAFAWRIFATDYLFFSNRIVQFPLGVFGIAIATAAFPRLSQDAVDRENYREQMAQTLLYSLRKIFFVMLPSAIGLLVIGRDVIGLIFDHGKFHQEGSLEPTVLCALFYAVGLPAFACVKVTVSAFYARQAPLYPVAAGALSVVMNVIFILLFIGPLGAGGLALATTLSSTINFLVLIVLLGGLLNTPLIRQLLSPLLRCSLCAVLMGGVVALVASVLPDTTGKTTIYLLRVAVLLPIGLLAYFGFSWLFQREETRAIIEAFARRSRRMDD